MGIFSRFFGTRKNEVPAAEPVLNDSEKLIAEEADNETQKENSNLSSSTVVINYGTGMPIDVVYNFISKDFETIGYEDAMCNDDPSYKSSKILIIKNDLMRLFEQVSLKYKQDITEPGSNWNFALEMASSMQESPTARGRLQEVGFSLQCIACCCQLGQSGM